MLDLTTPEAVRFKLQELQLWIRESNPNLTNEKIAEFIDRVETWALTLPSFTLYDCVELAVLRFPEFGYLCEDDQQNCTDSPRHDFWVKLINDYFGRELPGLDAWFLGYVAISLCIKNIYRTEEILFKIQCIYVDVDRNGKTFAESLCDNTGSDVNPFTLLWLMAMIVDYDRCMLTSLWAAAMD